MNFDFLQPFIRGIFLMLFFHLFSLAIYTLVKGIKSKKQEYILLAIALIIFPTVYFFNTMILSLGFFDTKVVLKKVLSQIGILIYAIAPLLYIYLKQFLRHEKEIAVDHLEVSPQEIRKKQDFNSKENLEVLYSLAIAIKRNLKHFVVLLVVLCLDIYYFFYLEKPLEVTITPFGAFRYSIFLFQNIIYTIISYFLVNKYSGNEMFTKEIKWIKILIYIFFIYWPIKLMGVFADMFLDHNSNIISVVQLSFFLILMYLTVFFLIIYKEKNKQAKYKNSQLTKEREEGIFLEVKAYLNLEKKFLDNDFSLPSLSKSLNISQKHISQAINSNSNSNFNDFVNSYRIEESATLLKETSKSELLISEVYYAVGFNSRSTFNTLFKKTFGITPSQYRKKYSKL